MIFLWVFCGLVFLLGLSVFVGAPYVPTHRGEIEGLFKELALGPNDVVVDLGSGDGVVLRAAAKQGAKAVGVEIHPVFFAISLILSFRWRNRVSNRLGNMWHFTLPNDTTIVFTFAASRYMARIEERVRGEAKRLGRPLTLICYGAPLAKLQPIKKIRAFSLYTIS